MKLSKLLFALPLVILFACGSETGFPGYDMTESGLYYQITESNDGGDQVEMGDILTLDLVYKTDDTVLYDSKMVDYPTQLRVGDPMYKGDVMEGFTMLKVGESASFKTRADSFFNIIAQIAVPDFVDSSAYLTFEVKVLNSQTMEEITAEKQMAAEANKGVEQELINTYLAENDITVEPKESGLYFVETAPGSGAKAERGNVVKVHYIGRLLTGEKFDASYDRGEPIEFTLGTGQVIPGWDEGIGYMTVGSKATLVIPSYLAYGENAPPGGIIKPFSPLVFDVELIEVN